MSKRFVLNNHSEALGQEDAIELLVSLLNWYLESILSRTSLLVTRKLSSALAAFLIRFHALWQHYIPHLVTCLATGQVDDPRKHGSFDHYLSALEHLDSSRVRAGLWVVENIMDDALKLDLNSTRK